MCAPVCLFVCICVCRLLTQLCLFLLAQLLLGKDGAVSPELSNTLSPEFEAQKVRLELLNVCHGAELASLPQPATDTPPRHNTPPQRLRQFDRITANVGKLLKLQVCRGGQRAEAAQIAGG